MRKEITTVLEYIESRPNSFSIDYNENWTVYESIDEYIEGKRSISEGYIDSDEERELREAGKVWQMRYYPDTPVGFIEIYSATFEKGLLLLYNYLIANKYIYESDGTLDKK